MVNQPFPKLKGTEQIDKPREAFNIFILLPRNISLFCSSLDTRNVGKAPRDLASSCQLIESADLARR